MNAVFWKGNVSRMPFMYVRSCIPTFQGIRKSVQSGCLFVLDNNKIDFSKLMNFYNVIRFIHVNTYMTYKTL